MRISVLFFLLPLLAATSARARVPVCLPAATELHATTDACIAGHVFDVVTVPGGTRFLDLCSPDTPDEECRISIVSYPKDSRQVGDLAALRGKDIQVRGAVESFQGRFVVVLNDERQFHGAPARFRPDPRLLRGSSSEEGDNDPPELRVNFHHHGRKLVPE